MNSNVCINVLGISAAIKFYVILEEDRSNSMILGRQWLIKAYMRNYWHEEYITIENGLHRQRNPFVLQVGAPTSDESVSDSLEADDSESEGIYTDDSSDDEVILYAIETYPKREVSPQRQLPIRRTRKKLVL